MPATIRVLVLTSNYPRNQEDHAGVFLHHMHRLLLPLGYDFTVLAPHYAGAATDEKLDGIRVVRFRYDTDPRETIAYSGNMQKTVVRNPLRFLNFLSAWGIRAEELLSQEKYDLIICHWLIPTGFVAQRFIRKHDIPLVLSSHGTDIRIARKFPLVTRLLFNTLFSKLTSWTVVSSYLREQVASLAPSNSDKIKVAYMPSRSDVFKIIPNVERKPHLIISPSRFTEQKRVPLLIEAFAIAAREIPDAQLELYGGGPQRELIDQLILKHSLQNRVSMKPSVTQLELGMIFNRAGIVVLNSYREGFGLVLSEAMRCGAAVIGTDSGGIPDTIDQEKTGLLAKEDDIQSLAECLLCLLKNEALRQLLAENGRKTVEQRFGDQTIARTYDSILRSAVGR